MNEEEFNTRLGAILKKSNKKGNIENWERVAAEAILDQIEGLSDMKMSMLCMDFINYVKMIATLKSSIKIPEVVHETFVKCLTMNESVAAELNFQQISVFLRENPQHACKWAEEKLRTFPEASARNSKMKKLIKKYLSNKK